MLFISTIAHSQIVNIPDANFKAKLLSASASNQIASTEIPIIFNGYPIFTYYTSIDLNNDGEIQVSEAESITYLNVSNDSFPNSETIFTLSGISSFTNLQVLSAVNNQISNIDLSSNVNLMKINLMNNNISNINLSGLTNLIELLLSTNSLISIDLTGMTGLKVLEVPNNQLSTINLDDLLNVKRIQCQNNNLNNLDVENLLSLEELDCYNNSLTNLNLLNLPSLINLKCSSNNLVGIELSSITNLEFLDCTFNNLQILDCMANSNLTAIYFIGNPLLHTVLIKNGSNESLNMDYGSWTENWMPFNNPSIQYVCVDENQYSNVLSLVGPGVQVTDYCSFTPGGDYNTITGAIIYDQANDGCDAFDLTQNYIRVDINDGTNTGASFTNATGNYSFYTQAGNFTLTPNIENPTWFNFSPISATIPFADNNNNIATQNFCITANGVHPDLEIVIAPIVPARPGFTAEYQIVYRNKGNQVMSQLYGVNFFYNQNLMSFVSATQVPSSIVSGGMSWDFANLMPFESRSINVIMQINAPTDTNPVNIGDVLQFTSSIMPMAGDESTVDNLFQLNQTVVGSYDPNDITCIEGDVVAPSYIGDFLHYVINFENTGTAPAENVVVKIEVNPSDFDINSLRILEASHNATIKITNNILEIIFQTIMLDTGGHGNVLLKVKSKENLVTNDIVTKNAKIYFDYNFPILTNDANTTFQVLSNSISTKDLAISLYPNPTSSLINIKAENVVKSIEIYDVQGRVIQVNKTDSKEVVLDVSTYNSGIYFVKVSTDFGSHIEKIVKD